MFQKRHVIGIVCLAMMAFAIGFYMSNHKKAIDPSQFNGTVLNTPRVISPFHLTGIDKTPFTNVSLQGQWTMMFFGFTHCQSMCPTAMAALNQMYRLLNERHVKVMPRVVMITLDPERDSLQRVNNYVKAFNPHFYGARGTEEAVNQMTREMGIVYAKIKRKNNHDIKDYDIEHTGAVMLFNPQGQLLAFFTTPHQPALLAKDYALLVS